MAWLRNTKTVLPETEALLAAPGLDARVRGRPSSSHARMFPFELHATAQVLATIALALIFTIPLLLYRLKVVLDPKRPRPVRHGRQNVDEPTHLLIVLGSGGHTAEMIAMLQRAVTQSDPDMRLNWKDFTHRTWVVSSGDAISAQRAYEFEERVSMLVMEDTLSDGKDNRLMGLGSGTYDIQTVPRAREIHQSLTTAPISCLKCLWACYKVLAAKVGGDARFPDLILCNGPATATILVFTSIILRFIDFRACNSNGKMRTIYVESWARVKKSSLSGTLLARVVDRFLVQWPQLEQAVGGRAEYMGVLV